jgi:hypothetical protein
LPDTVARAGVDGGDGDDGRTTGKRSGALDLRGRTRERASEPGREGEE